MRSQPGATANNLSGDIISGFAVTTSPHDAAINEENVIGRSSTQFGNAVAMSKTTW